MLAEERMNEILAIVGDRGTVTVQELTRILDTSESTIRRDLTELHRRGSLVKVHGGAAAVGLKSMTKDPSLSLRQELHREEKEKIAARAARLVEPGDFIYVDAGTTTELFTGRIRGRDVVCVTNAISHARELMKQGARVFLLGGELKAVTEAIVGADAVECLKKYNFTKGFFGANGVDRERGLTTPDLTEALVKAEAFRRCKERYVLADSSKLGQISGVTFGEADEGIILTASAAGTEFEGRENIMEVE